MESARAKYTLAQGRLRRGPPELTLLSLHGSLEDALRGHALRQRLPAAVEPFPQLLDALTTDRQLPLSEAEAEGIRRMHRLRARVAHGEQIAVTATTIDAYHRLVARLLPRYGVMVVGVDDEGEAAALPRPGAEPAQPRRRLDDVEAIPPRHSTERGRTTSRLGSPPRERSVYPDDQLARYSARPRRKADARDLFGGDAGQASTRADRWQRSQAWVLPLLIIVSIFLIGAAISISLQQLRAVQVAPTAAAATAFAPQITTVAPQPSPSPAQGVNGVQPQRAPATVATSSAPTAQPVPGSLAVGRGARVSAEISLPLSLRDRPGTDPTIPILLGLQPGTRVDVVGGPAQADGHTWWKVRIANIEGWCSGQYLEAQ
jgi:hypothetical protein